MRLRTSVCSVSRWFASELGRQKRAVAAVFFTQGLLLASWAPHIPYVKDRHNLADGTLGLVLLALAAGAVAAMSSSGQLSAWVGPHVVTVWSTIAMSAALPLPVVAPNVALVVVALAIFGGALGWMAVAMNAVAVDVDSRSDRPVMSSFHGMFSVGAVAGSLLAAGLIRLNVSPIVHTTLIGAVTVMAIWPSLRALPSSSGPVDEATRRFRFPRGRLLAIGAMTSAILFGEGAVVNWSATLLRDDMGASEAVAALGFGAFSTTMAIGRFTGDRINHRIGPAMLLRTGGAIAAVGLTAGLLIGQPVTVIVGFALMGVGFANTVPVLFTAAASEAPAPANGISAALTLGFLGFLVGPPFVGTVAEATNLTIGFALVAALAALVASQAQLVTQREAPARRAP